ncbi:putative membrane protein [Neolecta irregularis DAH-3]|uniref:Putative membrane protein n=1 Tax=Neolecta irregularis (strain DAH-3) TaxID=1198029 RepID=A0A1U7LSN8_NEOID|nr:putative membrane protein [Neolecta irregularis DAH-3]|eukprot:OLL25685.1 putative membrane protein [Neolecta irregularis DAH-3]
MQQNPSTIHRPFSSLNQLYEFISSRKAKRLLKCVVAYLCILILAVVPSTIHRLGRYLYIGHVVIIYLHPGRTIGTMLDQVAFTGFGILSGLGISYVGCILNALANKRGIRGEWIVFNLVILVSFVHGYLRSRSLKYASGAILMNTLCILALTTNIYGKTFPKGQFQQIVYPSLLAIAVALFCNIAIFPEQSTSKLGNVLIKNFQRAQESLSASTDVLLHRGSSEVPSDPEEVLGFLLERKTQLQQAFVSFQNVYHDSIYEFSYSCLSVRDMKYIKSELRPLVARISSLVGACKAAQIMLSCVKKSDGRPESRGTSFQSTLKRLENPLLTLKTSMNDSLDAISNAIGLLYNVKIQEGSTRVIPPQNLIKSLSGQAISLGNSIYDFDQTSQGALKALAMNTVSDIWTREEISLLSSFIVNIREASIHIIHCVKQTEDLAFRYMERKGRASIWLPHSERLVPPHIHKSKDQSRPTSSSTMGQRSLYDHQNSLGVEDWSWDVQKALTKESWGRLYRMSIWIDDIWRKLSESNNVKFGLKIMIGVSLLIWPVFVPQWNSWCETNKEIVQWASIGLIVVIDTSMGQTTTSYAYRACGTFLGGLYGWAVSSIHHGNPYVLTTLIGIACHRTDSVELNVPKFQIPALIFNITMALVALPSYSQSTSTSARDFFIRRSVGIATGGLFSILLHFFLFPVRARDKLIAEIGHCLSNICKMEDFLISSLMERDGSFTPVGLRPYNSANKKAIMSLTKASALLIATRTEPRVKAPFPSKEFEQIVYTLRKIIENFDNIIQFRLSYRLPSNDASRILLMAERKEVAGCVILSLYVSREALLTKIPLPQWLPSVRTSHQRLLEGVRQRTRSETDSPMDDEEMSKLRNICWNATTGIFEEIIEYIEELLGLVRSLVGDHELCAPPLTRPITPQSIHSRSRTMPTLARIQTLDDRPGSGITRSYSHSGSIEVMHRVQSRKLSMIKQ